MTESIVLGGGCFWCVEAFLSELRGVSEVLSGYAGGTVPDPTYEQVCSGQTGHAEVVRVEFDPKVISLHDLLTVFFTLHDPTTLNRQGNDSGTQYRSVVFYVSNAQKEEAQRVMQEIADRGVWEDPLVTTLEPLGEFYEAESYHQDYYNRQPNQGYCQVIIAPKVAKLRKEFADKLKA
ncbi:MAG: peptide-methionine (S)-S-oxide reductase MsrA [bacterium]